MHHETCGALLYRFYNNMNITKLCKKGNDVVAHETKAGARDVAVCPHRILQFGKCFQALT